MTKNEHIQSNVAQWEDETHATHAKQFRMTIHKVKRLKFMLKGNKEHASQCKHFALMWLPSALSDRVAFDSALQSLKYFVKDPLRLRPSVRRLTIRRSRSI